MPIGETRITRHGRNQRSFEKGLKNATPRPPVVMASRRPCDAVLAKTKAKAAIGDTPSHLANGTQRRATHAAKKTECVKPR